MAEEKDRRTEQPTSKKLEEAEQKGQVAYSAEFSHAVLLLGGLAFLAASGASISAVLQELIREALGPRPAADLDVLSASTHVTRAMERLAPAALPLLLGLLVIAAGVSYGQVGLRFRGKILEFKPERLDPIAGFHRMVSLRSLLRLATSLAKLAIIVGIVWSGSDDVIGRVNLLGRSPADAAAETGGALAFDLLLRIGFATLFVGGADLLYQRWQHTRDLMMSKQEVKDEFKNQLGNPQIKARIRRMQRAASQRRMMKDVPDATVVITNPTHFAVAVRYRRPGGLDPADDAPTVVAKGQDLLAKRIREIATEAGVPIVENPTLARTLYRTVEIGMAIPPDLYKAVAEVLAFVFRLRPRGAAR